jgi:hypothetical protein
MPDTFYSDMPARSWRMLRAVVLGAGAAVAAATVAAWVYLAAGPYLDRSALREATEFCDVVAVGQPIAALYSAAEKHAVELWEWPPQSGVVRYEVWFSGFLHNASTCTVIGKDGAVFSHYVEQHTW